MADLVSIKVGRYTIQAHIRAVPGDDNYDRSLDIPEEYWPAILQHLNLDPAVAVADKPFEEFIAEGVIRSVSITRLGNSSSEAPAVLDVAMGDFDYEPGVSMAFYANVTNNAAENSYDFIVSIGISHSIDR